MGWITEDHTVEEVGVLIYILLAYSYHLFRFMVFCRLKKILNSETKTHLQGAVGVMAVPIR